MSPATPRDASVADARDAITRQRNRWVEAIEAGDAASLHRLLARGVTWVLPGRAPLAGRTAVTEMFAAAFRQGSFRFSVDVEEVRVQSGWATERASFVSRLVRADEDGIAAPPPHHGGYVIVWRHDDEWRIRCYVDTTAERGGGAS